ncbi:hypothetical protein KMI_11g17140 [Encephalitozoon hellem]|nr:hypothetical protein KMI_11g17140 [Encephalitozoon hellem]
MEEDIRENSIPSARLGDQEIRIGETPSEDALVIYLSRGNRDKKVVCTKDNGLAGDINKCRKHKVDSCICLSKMHYEVDGDILCIREMKPFIYIRKVSILRSRSIDSPKATGGQKDT